jgi:hypothetical protein
MCSIDAFGLKCRICFMSAKFFSLARLCFGTEMDSCRLASAKDVVYQALFNVNDTDGEPQEHGDVTIGVISLICTHLYLTVSRLMKNQLPGSFMKVVVIIFPIIARATIS